METTLALIIAVVLTVVLLLILWHNKAHKRLVFVHRQQCESLETCRQLHQYQIDLRRARLNNFVPGSQNLTDLLQSQPMPDC